jgi:transcriptional regulator with XRE-family HTH domain
LGRETRPGVCDPGASRLPPNNKATCPGGADPFFTTACYFSKLNAGILATQKLEPRKADSTDVEVGRLVRPLRMSRGLSQTDLANRIGVTFQQVQKYESGANRISMGRLTNIAKLFGVSVPYLLDGSKQAAERKSSAKHSTDYTEPLEMLGRIERSGCLEPSPPFHRSWPICARASFRWSNTLRQRQQRVAKRSESEPSADK